MTLITELSQPGVHRLDNGDRHQAAHPQVGDDPADVPERQEAVVVVHRARAAHLELPVGLLDGAEERQRLVHQVRSQVVGDAAAVTAGRLRLPGRARARAAPLEPRLEAAHGPEGALADQAAHGQEVAVPPAVLEHGERDTSTAGTGDQTLPVPPGDGERLVDDDVEARFDRRLGQGDVTGRRRSDHHQVKLPGRLPQVLRRGQDPCAGVLRCRRRHPVRVRRHDRVDPVGGVGREQRAVEHAAAQPEADDPGADRGRHARPIRPGPGW